jgi:uncharacterized membrane protein YccC
MLDLDDLDGGVDLDGARGSSSWDAEDGTNPPYDALLHDCFMLKQRVVELELAASRVEEAVREELTSQQEDLLADMENQWMERIEKEHKKAEEKNKKLFALWQQEFIQSQQQLQIDQQMNKENASTTQNILPVMAQTGKATRKARA